MRYRNRQGEEIRENEAQDRLLATLYGTAAGRLLLKLLVQPWVSRLAGAFLNTPLSAGMIAPFAKRYGISLEECEQTGYPSYNAFFHRRLRADARPVDNRGEIFISPCDAKLSVYPIRQDESFVIKGLPYTLERLLRSRRLAERYEGGMMLVFRLTVNDYHHFCYVADGTKTKNRRIPGVLHTVNPIAMETVPVFAENAREYSLLKSEEFGRILMMEVGALMVGRIVNLTEQGVVRRGEEKGWFEFGGSTVILCLEKDRVELDEDIRRNQAEGIETIVRMGEKIGRRKSLQG